MEIRIASYLAASDLLEREAGVWDVLYILDSEKASTGFVEEHATSSLCLRFDDVDAARRGKQMVSREQVRQGLAFARGKQKLLVTCRAGQSRSAAMGYLACAQDLGVEAAVRLLDATRHSPNRLVVSLGAGVLGMGEVLKAFDEWRAANAGVRLVDYLDALEVDIEAMKARGVRDWVSH